MKHEATFSVSPFNADGLASAMLALQQCGIENEGQRRIIARKSWNRAVHAAGDITAMATPTSKQLVAEARRIAKMADDLRCELMNNHYIEGSANYALKERFMAKDRDVDSFSLWALIEIARGIRSAADDYKVGRIQPIRLTPQKARREAVEVMRGLVIEAGGRAADYVQASTKGQAGHRGTELHSDGMSPFARFVKIVLETVEGRALTVGALREAVRVKPAVARKRKQPE